MFVIFGTLCRPYERLVQGIGTHIQPLIHMPKQRIGIEELRF